MSSAERAREIRVGDRTESRGTPACILRGVGISPSADTLNFPSKKNDLINVIMLAENFNWNNFLTQGRVPSSVEGFPDIQEYRICSHIVIEF
jgi:hypothetical protein